VVVDASPKQLRTGSGSESNVVLSRILEELCHSLSVRSGQNDVEASGQDDAFADMVSRIG